MQAVDLDAAHVRAGHVPAEAAAREPAIGRVEKEVLVEDKRHAERHDREQDAAQAEGRDADHDPDQEGHQHARGGGHEVVEMEGVDQHPGAERGDAHERGLAERDLADVARQQDQREDGQAVDDGEGRVELELEVEAGRDRDRQG